MLSRTRAFSSPELTHSRLGPLLTPAGRDALGQNLFYNANGQCVYFTAGVGVIYTPAPDHTQHFFLGHTDDIKSIAMCSAQVQMGNTTFPARTIFATGQVRWHIVFCAVDCSHGKA